jgi:uncharacterized protein (TIGR00369 family)
MSKDRLQKMLSGELPMPKVSLTLGARMIDVDYDAGKTEAEYDGKEDFTNLIGNIQGGFLVAMLDDAMAGAIIATLKDNEFSPTLELHTNFIAPAKVGKLQAYARVVSRSGSVCVLEGELKQDGELVARSTATALIRKIR